MSSSKQITRIEGLDELVRKLKAAPDVVLRAAEKPLYDAAEDVMTDSKENRVPVDTGVLRSSGHVQDPERSGSRLTVDLGYGGQAADYAVPQHERLEYHHTVGEAKYLENAVERWEGAGGFRKLGEAVGKKLEAELRE